MSDNVSKIQKVRLLILIGWCILCTRYFFPHMGDDSFIFFRYAAKFGQGHGLQWNSLSPAVEGYSSPLWTLWLGVWSKWFDTVLVAQLTGLLCTLFVFIQIWRLVERSQGILWGVFLTMGFHYWGTSGLETPLYTLLLINVFPLLQASVKPNTMLVSWVSLGLLGICRPESPAIVCGVLMLRWWQRRTFPREAILVCVPMLLWQAVRGLYYGDVLPNTYWAKASGDWESRLLSGWVYGGWLGIPLTLGTWKSEEKSSWLLLTTLWGVVVLGGGDWMWHHRLLIPVIVGVWLLSSKLVGIWKWCVQIPLIYYWMSPLLVWSALSSIWTGKTLSITEYQEGNLIEVSENLASDIRAVYPDTIRIAVNHAGALPYFLPEHEFIDMSALNDRYLARLEGGLHEKYDADYVLEQDPELIVLNSFVDPKSEQGSYQPNYWVGETSLYQHPQFTQRYVPIAQSWRRVRHGGGFASVWLFKRRKQ